MAGGDIVSVLVTDLEELHRFGNWHQQWVTLRHAAALPAGAGDDFTRRSAGADRAGSAVRPVR